MNLFIRFIVVAIAVAFIVIAGRGTQAEQAKPNDASANRINPNGDAKPVGSAGCSGSNCHGGARSDKPADLWKSSYTTFMGHDKHTQAYEVLKGQRSTDIVKRWSHDVQHDATKVWQCLACHSNPTLAKIEKPTPAEIHLQSEGVSCEACHGNASKYLHAHTGWAAPFKFGEARDGLAGLNIVEMRAQNCAGCHVGAPADQAAGVPLRDVTHDMIAAGHPRLNFEMAEYSRLMPSHWWERDRVERNQPRDKDFQATTWVAGQHAEVESRIKLLQSRLGSDAAVRWPEFAEFNCYACHHDLQPASWRRDAVRKAPGSLEWNYPGIRSEGAPWSIRLSAIDKQLDMRTGDKGKLDDAIRQLLFERRIPTIRGADTFLNLTDTEWQNLDWDQAARIYAAGVALAQPKLDDPKIVAAIKSLHSQLKFKSGIDSPAEYTPATTREALRKFIDMVR